MQRLLIFHESSKIIQLSCFVLYPSSFVDSELQKPRGQLLISESEIRAGSLQKQRKRGNFHWWPSAKGRLSVKKSREFPIKKLRTRLARI